MGFFDTTVQEEDAKKSETAEVSIPEKTETETVSAFFALPEEPASESDASEIIILDDTATSQETAEEDGAAATTAQEPEEEAPVSPLFAAPEQDKAEEKEVAAATSAPAMTEAKEESPSAAISDEADAGDIILEAIVKMTALHDRKAGTRDSIMAEVEDINAQIAMLKDKARDRTARAKDIAAEMKKIEESIAVLQTQKAA